MLLFLDFFLLLVQHPDLRRRLQEYHFLYFHQAFVFYISVLGLGEEEMVCNLHEALDSSIYFSSSFFGSSAGVF
jgi:hypothetical protein